MHLLCFLEHIKHLGTLLLAMNPQLGCAQVSTLLQLAPAKSKKFLVSYPRLNPTADMRLKLFELKRKMQSKLKMNISKDVEVRNFIVQLFFPFEELFLSPFVKVPDMSVHVQRHFLIQFHFEDESVTSHVQLKHETNVFS